MVKSAHEPPPMIPFAEALPETNSGRAPAPLIASSWSKGEKRRGRVFLKFATLRFPGNHFGRPPPGIAATVRSGGKGLKTPKRWRTKVAARAGPGFHRRRRMTNSRARNKAVPRLERFAGAVLSGPVSVLEFAILEKLSFEREPECSYE